MNKAASLVLAGILLSAPCFAQQEKNPNQQQEQTGPKNQPPPDNPGQNTPSQPNPDIPSSKPGTNNPDIAPDSKPAAPTSPEHKGKAKRRKQTSSSSHTAPTS
jgi:hypothetical protein